MNDGDTTSQYRRRAFGVQTDVYANFWITKAALPHLPPGSGRVFGATGGKIGP